MSKQTVMDLGRLKKREYPGEFDAFSDIEVGMKFKIDNPGKYDSYRDLAPVTPKVDKTEQKAKPRSNRQKFFAGLESTLGVAASPTVKNVLAPAAQKLTKDPVAIANLEKLKHGKETRYGSDVVEQLAPGAFQHFPGESLGETVGKIGSRIAIDTATDLLSYVGIGLPTKLGRLVKLVHEATQAGKKIKLTSPLAKQIAKEMGYKTPTPAIINKFKQQYGRAPSKNLSQQIASGEKSLVSAGLPFGGEGAVPLLKGKLAGKVVAPLSGLRRGVVGAKLERAVREVFSTKSGDPDFDVIASHANDIAAHRAGLKVEEGAMLNEKLTKLSRDMGLPRAEINKMINNAIESVRPTPKGTYKRGVFDALQEFYHDKLLDAQVGLKNAQKAGNAVDVERYAKDVTEWQGQLNQLTGKYTKPPSVNPEFDKVVEEIMERQARQLFDEQVSGHTTKALLADIEYLPHILTPEARNRLVEIAQMNSKNPLPARLTKKEVDDFLVNTLRREFVKVKPQTVDGWVAAKLITKNEARSLKGKKGLDRLEKMLESGRITDQQFTDVTHTLSIEEVNEIGRQGMLGAKWGTAPIQETFHVDPVFYTTIRGMRGERARTYTEFFNEIKARGLALPEGDPKTPGNYLPVRHEALKGYKVSPEIARVLNRVHAFQTNPNELRQFLNLYDRFHGLNKIWTLAIFPAYHTMNMVGNVWNNWLAGLNNPIRYADAIRVQTGKKIGFTDVYGEHWDQKKLLKRAQELGVVDKGWFAADVERTIKQRLDSKSWRQAMLDPTAYVTPSSRNNFLRLGTKVGKIIENNARMAHFIDRIRKGDTVEEAATSVKKFLFDYSDLTDIEKNIFNRGFFFYTWTRKNIPLQLTHLVQQPYKFGIPYKFRHEVEKQAPPAPEKYLQDYLKDNFQVRIRYNSKTKSYEYFTLARWLPAADIVKLSHLHEVAVNMLAPLPKETLQQIFNFDIYKSINKGELVPIERVPGEKEKFLGRNMNRRVVHGAKLIRLLNEIDKMSKQEQDIYSTIVGILTGRNYQFNPDEGRKSYMLKTKGEIDKMIPAAIAAQARGDTAEVSRIRSLMQERAWE